MSEHFKGKYEVEFKYRLSSKAKFLAALMRLNPEIRLEDNHETDWFYDQPDNDLADQRKSVSIREMEPSGIKLWIVKGPGKDCCEAVNISDVSRARSMLETMGFVHTMTLAKTRSMYFINQYHVTLDYLEGFGHFAEFAIMTDDFHKFPHYKQELKRLASSCQLHDGDIEHRSYKELVSGPSILSR